MDIIKLKSRSPFYKDQLVTKCISSGIMMRVKAPSSTSTGAHQARDRITHAPLTLQPTSMPSSTFHHLVQLTTIWNSVIHRVVQDKSFLRNALQESAISDSEFLGRLLCMYEQVYCDDTQYYQPMMLGIFRSDYMPQYKAEVISNNEKMKAGKNEKEEEGSNNDHIDKEGKGKQRVMEWKHVEINTISASFGALSTRVGRVHQYLHQVHYGTGLQKGKDKEDEERHPRCKVIVSEAEERIAAGLFEAHQCWCKMFDEKEEAPHHRGGHLPPPLVCFVVQEGERNTTDQYLLSFVLLEKYGVRSIRRSLQDLAKEASTDLDETSHRFSVYEEEEEEEFTRKESVGKEKRSHFFSPVSVFYFRSTYTVTDFPTETEWITRKKLECSSAIKCPSLPYHLCTMKRVQQLLSRREVLQRYVCDPLHVDLLLETFVPQYALSDTLPPSAKQKPEDDDDGKEHLNNKPKEEVPSSSSILSVLRDAQTVETKIAEAIATPKNYVLKVQKEGGGNLIYGEEMKHLLEEEKEGQTKKSTSSNSSSASSLYQKVRQEYILMERINKDDSCFSQGAIMRDEQIHFYERLSCEFGTFGYILASVEKGIPYCEWVNAYAGYLMRTKPTDAEDGGVMSGVAALDSVELI